MPVSTDPSASTGCQLSLLQTLYRWMLTAREIDRRQELSTRRGEAFFQLSGTGHEATAALGPLLLANDWLHCHYRSRALLLARGIPPERFFDNLLANGRSDSHGRRMGAFFHDPDRNVVSMVTPVGNQALQSVGIAQALADDPTHGLVVCGIGDGTTQQGEFLEACCELVRSPAPLLMLIEDNGLAISTPTTGRTCVPPQGTDGTLLGLPVHHIDGRHVSTAYRQLQPLVTRIRQERRPLVAVMHVARLCSHTSADDQAIYRDADELARQWSQDDPVANCRQELLNRGVPPEALERLHEEVMTEVEAAEQSARRQPPPVLTSSAKTALPVELSHPSWQRSGQGPPELTMREALLQVFDQHLASDPRVSLLGQDIEDPKGDVFGLTRGLSSRYPGRVRNAPLAEATIVGVSIGRALAGQRPVAMIQFADFLPLAYNQIASELATLSWRTCQAASAPVIIMAACGAYRPGLGPYHSQTTEATYAHIPGLDVVMPSTAGDAAGLLQAAFASPRPTLFLYPKALLNDVAGKTSRDVDQQFVPIGRARNCRRGRDLTLVGWGNTVKVCEAAADQLQSIGIHCDVWDLRSLSPWDEQAVVHSAEATAHLIVVHEDNHTCGLGGEILATVAEKARVPVAMRRVTRPDTHLPYNYEHQCMLLPSVESVLEMAAELLNLEVTWEEQPKTQAGVRPVLAVGSGPADDQVQVVEWLVEAGQRVERNEPLVTLEASKSVFELPSPAIGTVHRLAVAEGEWVAVGHPVLELAVEDATGWDLPAQSPRIPRIRRRRKQHLSLPRQSQPPRHFLVGLSRVATVEGERIVTNDELVPNGILKTSQDIIRRTGIEQRRWAGPSQTAVNLAVQAARAALRQQGLDVSDIDMLVCSTTSPTSVTPSMACQVLNQLAGKGGEAMMQAFDINAACSGYLYALQTAYDFLQSQPRGRVMVVTTEVLSPLLDRRDTDTTILFGDAASATVVYGEHYFGDSVARLHRPELSAKGDMAGALSVPFVHEGFIRMRGQKVFSEAVRAMIASLNRTCGHHGWELEQLKLIVPHQANQRILDAIQQRVAAPVFSNIRHHGNTSSSSIPLCLDEILPDSRHGDRLGLCAFGGGFTFGASLVEVN